MNQPLRQSRRRMLKSFVLFTATSLVLGRKWMRTVLAQASPDGSVFRLRISDYPALGEVNGSVRLGTSALQQSSASCLTSSGILPPVLINRGAGNQFYALSAACTHEGCTVPKYNAATGFSQCPNHGSRFGLDGDYLPRSGPVEVAALVSYPVHFDSTDQLAIEVPDLLFDLKAIGVQAPGEPVGLRFLAFANLSYEVRFRASLTEEGVPVPFSETPGGATAMTLPGDDAYHTLYVDAPSAQGFYSIAVVLFEV